ncbi:hypothetical protein HZY97_02145 [Sphingomonas sp. R-74633]|uniref:hypothetical protein n=1 Tax=Sphingomonas sp. R-74633 TaxID=2751188 RepID=UPI0015D16157|nr:hypothetical protein [Sphingomonas sp. R-74633]NYT39543.1 hypothetical protein [Sphingomonas sp. R-74633]
MRRYPILAPLLLAAAPASAQTWGGPTMQGPSGSSMGHDQRAAETAKIRSDIRDGRDSGQLTRREAKQLKREAYQIDTLEERYATGGLSPSEEAELFVRREALRNDVTAKRTGTRK